MPFETWEEFGAALLGAPLRIALIIVGAVVLRWLIHRSIRGVETAAATRAEDKHRKNAEKVADPATAADIERRHQRALTLGSLLRSVATFTIAAVTILTVMAEVNIPVGPLLASAGVGGVALGFGAQALVKDFLSGIFMIIEDQYGVGDLIDTGEAIGTVEEVTLRITRLRDLEGVVWFVRNGEIVRIGNKSEGWSLATIDIPVSYDEEPARVIPLLDEVTEQVWEDPELHAKLIEQPSVAGVESVSGGVMTLRIFAKCKPGEQWAMPRDIRRRVKASLDKHGVRGPQITPYGPGS
ncbi:MAG TPA: mechanosensitive ion channel family protein [Ornithinimicrobium sp.]|uniref:mechanosensitive ion channel family protein n=1 Tax=Ornithinimicrobium sp. TaxID=1977084 RepID=UPI002B491A50|nr:mechanosensitive ion channel family protein [Ornithinimicrobium sp.]HKJ12813.1 mechanosensitive ion channel family protein [Ornithinimicrobium sp.]